MLGSYTTHHAARNYSPCARRLPSSTLPQPAIHCLRSDNNELYTLPGFSLFYNDFDGGAEWLSVTGAFGLCCVPCTLMDIVRLEVNLIELNR